MLRLIAVACLIAWAGLVQAAPHIVYTRHAISVDVHDLDLARSADLIILKARIVRAADEVCGGRPEHGRRYDQAELKLLLPAYEQCRTAAIQRAAAGLKVPARVLTGNEGEADENDPAARSLSAEPRSQAVNRR